MMNTTMPQILKLFIPSLKQFGWFIAKETWDVGALAPEGRNTEYALNKGSGKPHPRSQTVVCQSVLAFKNFAPLEVKH